MGHWQGDDYREIPLDDTPNEDYNTVQRRAHIYREVQECGHPALLDKDELSETLDITRRQVYYDIEAVAEFVEDTAGERHIGENHSVFERAKREALQRGDLEMAIAVLKDEAEWLENRGAIDKQPDEIDVTWREYIENE